MSLKTRRTKQKIRTSAFLLVASTLLLLATGCSKVVKKGLCSEEKSIPLAEGSDASLYYSYNIEYAVGGVSKEAASFINRQICRLVLSNYEDAEAETVPEACDLWKNTLIDDYRQSNLPLEEEDYDSDYMPNWNFEIDGEFTGGYAPMNLLTYTFSSDDFSGGAHGFYESHFLAFDKETGKRVVEEDIFKRGFEDILSELIFKGLEECFEEEEIDESVEEALFVGRDVSHNGNFTIDKRGITWHYNPYDIAAYVYGSLSSFVSWEDLKPILK